MTIDRAADCLAITAEVRDALRRAAGDATRERCGLLFGRARTTDGAVATRCVELPNERAAVDAFTIDPARVVAAARDHRARGLDLVAVWHTHPRGAAVASAADLAGCRAGWCVVIAAGDDLAAYAAGDGRALALRVVREPA